MPICLTHLLPRKSQIIKSFPPQILQYIYGKGLHTSLGLCCVSKQDLLQLSQSITRVFKEQFSHCDGQQHAYVMWPFATFAGVLQER